MRKNGEYVRRFGFGIYRGVKVNARTDGLVGGKGGGLTTHIKYTNHAISRPITWKTHAKISISLHSIIRLSKGNGSSRP